MLTASLPNSVFNQNTRNHDGPQKVRNSLNNADLVKREQENSFTIQGKKTSVSVYSRSNAAQSRDGGSSRRQAKITLKEEK